MARADPVHPSRACAGSGVHGSGPASGQLSAARWHLAQHCGRGGTQGVGTRRLEPPRRPHEPETRVRGVRRLWGLFRHEVAAHWYRGQAAILGDAAHPTLPFMAQGANMALEDAYVLARELARANTISEALAAYQAARRDHVIRVVKAANRNARNYHLRAPVAQIAHLALRISGKLMPNAPLRQFAWMYDHDVTEA